MKTLNKILLLSIMILAFVSEIIANDWNEYCQFKLGIWWSTHFNVGTYYGTETNSISHYQFTNNVLFDNKECLALKKFNSKNSIEPANGWNHCLEGSKIFIASKEYQIVYAFRTGQFEPRLEIDPNKLIQIGDFESDELQEYYDTTFIDLPLYDGAVFNGTCTISGENAIETWHIKGSDVEAYNFKMYCNFLGTVSYQEKDTLIDYNMTGSIVYGKGIGMLFEGWEYPEIKHIYANRIFEYRWFKDSVFDYEVISRVEYKNNNNRIIVSPNPFSQSTTINYELREAEYVSLKLFDMLGNEVANLVDGFMEAGRHEARFDGTKLANGVYNLQMLVGNVITNRLLVISK